jgi:hypothetical protein
MITAEVNGTEREHFGLRFGLHFDRFRGGFDGFRGRFQGPPPAFLGPTT